MRINQLSKNKNNRTKKRVGRGGKHGTYSGRGLKGQKSRAGRKLRPEWRDSLKRIPKRRGYRFKSIAARHWILNLDLIVKNFGENELVDAASLLKKGLVDKIKGRMPEIKILGDGELTKKLDFKGIMVSAGARAKIEKAGGVIK